MLDTISDFSYNACSLDHEHPHFDVSQITFANSQDLPPVSQVIFASNDQYNP